MFESHQFSGGYWSSVPIILKFFSKIAADLIVKLDRVRRKMHYC